MTEKTLKTFFHEKTGVYNVEYSPPPPGNKIKWFGDGEENQKLEKKKKKLKILHFWQYQKIKCNYYNTI